MKRILIEANTYYQLILAVQMRCTIFSESEVVLLLSDHSKNSSEIYERLHRCNCFSEVHYVKTLDAFRERKIVSRMTNLLHVVFSGSKEFAFELADVENLYFDELICFNYGIGTVSIFSILYKYNKRIKFSFFEEGLLSYGKIAEKTIGRRLIKLFRNILGKKDITDVMENFYCYVPELYHGELNAVKVPKVSYESECCDILKAVFLKGETPKYSERKYIFFTSVYDFEGGEAIGEYEAACKAEELVGKDNLLIKLHPRDSRTIYVDNGFEVDCNSAVPWEVIQLSCDFSDKVFITATSGSVLAANFMSDYPTRTFFCYKLCDMSNNAAAQNTVNNIEKILQEESVKKIMSCISVIDNMEEILE